MPHSRFFIDEPFYLNKEIVLADEEYHHISVMRIQLHEDVEVVNGKNQLAIAEITHLAKKNALLKIIKITENIPMQPQIILAQALVRNPKLDLILEKCTEIGVSEFILFKADNSETEEVSPNRKQRMESILISSLKQCGRLDLPKISYFESIKKFKSLNYQFLFGDLSSNEPLNINNISKDKRPVCFLIGPEKGFSSKEETFLNEELKAKGIKINQNILRTETAAITAAALLSQIHKI